MTGVPVTTTAFTNVNSAALPIAPPTATLRTVNGTVTPATATVRALQTYTGGPTVEVAWAPVDADQRRVHVRAADRSAGEDRLRRQPARRWSSRPMPPLRASTRSRPLRTARRRRKAIDAAAVVPPVTFTFP